MCYNSAVLEKDKEKGGFFDETFLGLSDVLDAMFIALYFVLAKITLAFGNLPFNLSVFADHDFRLALWLRGYHCHRLIRRVLDSGLLAMVFQFCNQ
jgi:hypothetical protein